MTVRSSNIRTVRLIRAARISSSGSRVDWSSSSRADSSNRRGVEGSSGSRADWSKRSRVEGCSRSRVDSSRVQCCQMAETLGKKLKRGRRKINLPGRFGGRILPDFSQKWQKRGRRKFKFEEFSHLLDAELCSGGRSLR
jgi:hypothetical protein